MIFTGLFGDEGSARICPLNSPEDLKEGVVHGHGAAQWHSSTTVTCSASVNYTRTLVETCFVARSNGNGSLMFLANNVRFSSSTWEPQWPFIMLQRRILLTCTEWSLHFHCMICKWRQTICHSSFARHQTQPLRMKLRKSFPSILSRIQYAPAASLGFAITIFSHWRWEVLIV